MCTLNVNDVISDFGKRIRSSSSSGFHCCLSLSVVVINVMSQYLAPFAGATIGSDLRDRGRHALVVFDDLGAHGDAYTQMARACPHPIHHHSYIHGRLLERSAQLSKQRGGG